MSQGDLKGQKALVTGGSGLLGRHLVSALLNRGMEVCVMDLSSPPKELGPVDFIKGSVTEAEAVMEACLGCKVAFHLAGRRPAFQKMASDRSTWAARKMLPKDACATTPLH